MPMKTVLAASMIVNAIVAADAAETQSAKVWRHGIVEAKSDSGIVMMPGQHGFAEKRGLKIEYVQFKGDALALKALIAGELDSYEGSPGGPMIAASRHADVKIVGCYWPGLTYGIFVGRGIANPEDLKGKSFGISSPGSLPDLFARTVLEKYNIDPSQVTFAAMGSDADRFRAVSAGVIQAAAASTEFTPLVEKQGIRLLLHAHDVAPNYLRFCTYMSNKTMASKPAEASGFLSAEMEGIKYALTHRDETVALSKTMTDAKPEDEKAGYVFDEVKQYSAVDPTMPIPRDKLAWMKDLLVRTGNLTAPLDLDKMIDETLRQQAEIATSGN